MRHIERYSNIRNIGIIKILLNTGLRVQELCNLKWLHVTSSERKGKLIVNSGKGAKYREVPLNKDVRDAFDNFLIMYLVPVRFASSRYRRRCLVGFAYCFNQKYWTEQIFNRLLYACIYADPVTLRELRV